MSALRPSYVREDRPGGALCRCVDAIAEEHLELSAWGFHYYRTRAEGFRRVVRDGVPVTYDDGRYELTTSRFMCQVGDALAAFRPGDEQYRSDELAERIGDRLGRWVEDGAAIIAMIIKGFEPVREARAQTCTFAVPRVLEMHPACCGPEE